jgi:hypothetical protein
MSYQPPPLPATWHEEAVRPSSHTVDLTGARSVSDELAGLEDSVAYCREYRRGVGKDYTDLIELGAVRRAGNDREGNPLYLVIPGLLLPDSDLARVRRFALQLMRAHAREGQPFSMLFVQNNVNPAARAVSAWFVVETYRMLPRAFKRNLRFLGVLHPTAFVRSLLLVLAPFLAESFWDKLYLVERIEFADDVVGGEAGRIEALEIPGEYYEWDDELEARADEDADALRSGALYGGGLGMGGPMGGALFNGGVPPR